MSQTVQASPEAEAPQSPFMMGAQIVIGLVAVAALIYFKPELARTIAVFLVTLGVLVFVHEWGHYQFARWAGLKVNRFALGFPPFIYTRRKNGIDYSIGALPIGGMVDIAGLGSEEEMVGITQTGEVPENSRNPNRPFGQKQFQDANLGWRFMVLFAGPLMNFLFAIVAFIAVYTVAGSPIPMGKPQVMSVKTGFPAEKAGLKPNDFILKVGGKTMRNPNDVTSAIHENKTNSINLTVERQGKEINLPIKPVMADLSNKGKDTPTIGIEFGNAIQSFTYKKLTPREAVSKGFSDSLTVSLNIIDTIKRAVSRNLSSDEVKSIGGPVRIAQTVGQASSFGWPILLQFGAMLSVNLGLMNLLPLPALDGGRILFLGYELVMRRPFDPRKEGLVHAAGMVLLLTFMLYITLRDVAHLGG